MKKLQSWVFRSLVVVALGLSGCVVGVGNRPASAERPTAGQELIDLKRARDSGAINEDEYQAQKKKLLEGRKAQ